MTFNYDLETAVGQVRLEVSDTTENGGVLPNGANLSDEEIQVLLDRNDDEVLLAAADACDIIARRWSSQPDSIRIGSRQESGSQADKWRQMAADRRGRVDGRMVSAGAIPVDGYSDDVASDAVDDGSEYA